MRNSRTIEIDAGKRRLNNYVMVLVTAAQRVVKTESIRLVISWNDAFK